MKLNFEKYCKDYEKIENFEKALADNFKGWHCHHRLETWNSDGERRLVDITRAELVALNMYYGRPPEELIFLTVSEHHSLHHKGKQLSEEHKRKMSEARKGKRTGEKNPFYGKRHSEETRNRISEARKGKCTGEKNPMYGRHHTEDARKKVSEANKGKHHTEEAKKKMREAQKGHPVSEETKKKLSEAMKGKQFTEEHKKKLSEARKGIHWYNNGKINVRVRECPPGFVPGILK